MRTRRLVGAADWTPVVLLVCSLSLFMAALAWALPRWLAEDPAPAGPDVLARNAPAEITLWVHRPPVEGVKVALAPVWGDAGPDRDHDATLARTVSLPLPEAPAWYRLLLFNGSKKAERVALAHLGLALEGAGGRAEWVNVPALLAGSKQRLPASQERLLRSLGALEESVELPPGSAVPLLTAFSRRVDLAEATRVAGADAWAFVRRPMGRGEFQRLLSDPDEALVRDL
jgi:hypothetical protein